jgi:hypothetical protein
VARQDRGRGDLNGDGRPDLVLGGIGDVSGNYANLTIALGNGDGTFTLQTSPVLVGATGVVSIVLADLNGDGKLDLVTGPVMSNGWANNHISVALGDGKGGFQPGTRYAVLSPSYLSASAVGALAVGDLNGDGIPDIGTAGGTILFGDGLGGFPTRADSASSANGSIMLADFDGDGNTDIIFGNGIWRLPVLQRYRSLAHRGVRERQGWFTGAPVSGVALPVSMNSIASADFNGDGIADAVVVGLFLNGSIFQPS